ncbi:MAG: hypothetical protein P4L99_04065 [Chthoniobacter sp.]|nr:hypothetical protein [Chthoniobacter sp.]
MSIEVPNRDEWFPKVEGFPRPNWPAIWGWERAWASKEDRHEAAQQVVRHWLTRLRDRLGGTYAVGESEHFHLLSAQDEKARGQMLHFLGSARARSLQILGDVAWTDGAGKHVVLRFTDLDDYYAYISHYYPDGQHAGSGGLFLRADYCHIAYYEKQDMNTERATLAHELAHNLVAHLPLPSWLNEALAEAFEADVSSRRFAVVDRELHAEHESYWNAETIQEFWAGRSFHTVEGQRVSYSLAQVLLDIINREVRPPPEVFRRFVKQSTWQDAGEAAALEQFEVSLGEIASVFLSEGDWTPKPASWKTKSQCPSA